jgi:O-antigen/teichoic acid export membrane protein
LALPLAAAAALYGMSRVGVGLAMAAGRTRIIGVADVTAMVVSVGGYLALIPYYGAMGAALGSLAGYGVAAAISLGFVATGRKGQEQAGPCHDSEDRESLSGGTRR